MYYIMMLHKLILQNLTFNLCPCIEEIQEIFQVFFTDLNHSDLGLCTGYSRSAMEHFPLHSWEMELFI